MRTSARMLPWKILNAQCGRHVRVAKVIVNNNPETMKRSRPSFRTAAGWCFARTQHASARLASFGQNDGRVRLAKMPRARSSSSLETRAHAFEFAERLRMRAPQDEGERRACSPSSRCQTAHLVPAAHFCVRGFATLLHRPRTRGGGAPRNVRVRARHPLGVPISAFTRVFDAMNAARQALARRLASRNAGRSPLGAPPWPPSPAHSRASGNLGRGLRHTPLRLQDRLRRTPLTSEDANLLA
jgi:hypothetical protein